MQCKYINSINVCKRGMFDPPGKPLNFDGFQLFFGWSVFLVNGTLWHGENPTFEKKKKLRTTLIYMQMHIQHK